MNHQDPHEAADREDDEFGDRHLDEAPPAKPDFRVSGGGSLYILYADSQEAEQWVEDHLPEDRQTWGRNGTAVEHRYISDIVNGIEGDGLTVAWGG